MASDRAPRRADGDVEERDQRRRRPRRPTTRRAMPRDDAARPTGASRRNHSATQATAPSATSTAIARLAVLGPRWRRATSAPSPAAISVHRESTTQSRAERRPSRAVAQLARQQHALPARQRDVVVDGGRHRPDSVRTDGRRDPRPKSTRASTAGRGARGPRAPILPAMIDSEGLTKRYGGRTVVQDVSFRCEPGTVTGFLGPERRRQDHDAADALRPLASPTRAGRPCSAAATATCPTRRAASASCSTPPRSTRGRRGREALAVSAQTIGVPERRVDDLLELVGLDRSAARKRVRQYSLGMRQRLGLAHALLGDPEVLILDEPANGLDPEGMRWMRGLLRDFADRGGTVLLSSHLLGEVAGGRRPDRDHRRRAHRRPGQPRRAAGRRGHARARGRRDGARRRAAQRRPRRPPGAPTAASSSTPSPRPSGAPRSTAASRSPTSGPPRAPASSSCSST